MWIFKHINLHVSLGDSLLSAMGVSLLSAMDIALLSLWNRLLPTFADCS